MSTLRTWNLRHNVLRAGDEFKQERLPVETRIARGSTLGSELVDWQRHIRDGGCEWWRTSRQSETLQNSLGRIRWMDGRENFHRAAVDFALENVHQEGTVFILHLPQWN